MMLFHLPSRWLGDLYILNKKNAFSVDTSDGNCTFSIQEGNLNEQLLFESSDYLVPNPSTTLIMFFLSTFARCVCLKVQ